jgi:valyl-tRNA synthetase
MTTMGWRGPFADHDEATQKQLAYYLPSNLLVTGPDIIFFWVARMIMATVKFRGTVPFKDVYFTSIIRDAKGRKLSKSLGNSPDPLNIINQYGSDAIRFTMIYLAPLGSDVRLDIDEKTQDIPSMELGRNFANKVWNVCRFLQMKEQEIPSDVAASGDYQLSTADRWIRSRYASTVATARQHLEHYRITEYSKCLYDFIWRDFCDWYVEIVKVQSATAGSDAEKRAILAGAFDIIDGTLKLLHPVMPFLTEELWHGLYGHPTDESISVQQAPASNQSHIEPATEQRFETLQLVVEAMRRQRAEMGIPPSERLDVVMRVEPEHVDFFTEQHWIISSLARCASLTIASDAHKPEGSVADVVRGNEIFMVVAGKVDLEKERARMQKEITRLQGAIAGVEKKLSNASFVQNAKPEVVEVERQKLRDWSDALDKLTKNVAAL